MMTISMNQTATQSIEKPGVIILGDDVTVLK